MKLRPIIFIIIIMHFSIFAIDFTARNTKAISGSISYSSYDFFSREQALCLNASFSYFVFKYAEIMLQYNLSASFFSSHNWILAQGPQAFLGFHYSIQGKLIPFLRIGFGYNRQSSNIFERKANIYLIPICSGISIPASKNISFDISYIGTYQIINFDQYFNNHDPVLTSNIYGWYNGHKFINAVQTGCSFYF
jgi:hypothetical protein